MPTTFCSVLCHHRGGCGCLEHSRELSARRSPCASLNKSGRMRFLRLQLLPLLLARLASVAALRLSLPRVTNNVSRSPLCVAVLVAQLSFMPAAFAIDESSPPPSATALVVLDMSIARGPTEPVGIDLYGAEAPAATKIFLSICSGSNPYGVSYDQSSVGRVIKDEEITIDKFYKGSDTRQETWMDEVGKVRIRSVDLAEGSRHSDANTLLHRAGSLSVPRGGGSFAFTLATGPSVELDARNVVIGQVTSDPGNVLAVANAVPTSREDSLGMKGGFAALGRAGGDGRARLAKVDRPLKKISVLACRVSEEASLTSFLRLGK